MSEDDEGVEDAAQAEPASAATRAVRRVLKQWRSQLIDVSAANRLLFYRDLKVATVDLSGASQSALAELAAGRAIRVGRLWADSTRLAETVRSLKAIAKPARVYAEEFGLQITFIASGFATWQTADGSKEPCAPVLLRTLSFRVLPGSVDGFELEGAEDPQVNPVLLHFLEAEYGVKVDEAELLEGAGGDEELLFERLAKICEADLAGFAVERRAVIANFAYAAQSMVADLGDENAEFLAGHDMVAALAGDPDASQRVMSQGADVRLDAPDTCPPSDEHLILDADGSQSYVINAIVGGQHLVVQGPPGTGKTQTITNTIAELVARGKTVLFVAQKRAAITAVLDRLRVAKLDGLVLDLFDGANSRKAIVQELGATIERAGITPRPKVNALHEAYADARDLLVSHRLAMHELRMPWEMSLLGSKDPESGECFEGFFDWAIATRDAGGTVRLKIADLRKWDANTHHRLRRELEELFTSGGLAREQEAHAGWSVAGLSTTEAVATADQVVSELGETLVPDAIESMRQLVGSLGIAQPPRLAGRWCVELLGVLQEVEACHQAGASALLDDTGVPDEVLRSYVEATADRAHRGATGTKLGVFARRSSRKELKGLVPNVGTDRVHEAVASATEVRSKWTKLAGSSVPSPEPSWEAGRRHVDALVDALEVLEPFTQGLDLNDFSELETVVSALARDRSRRGFPRIHALRTSVAASGAQPVLDDLTKSPPVDGQQAADRLSHAFSASVIEHFDKADTRLAGFGAAELNRATDALIKADEELRNANISRVRRAAAEKLVLALDSNPEQAASIRGQVKRKRGFQPIRRLVDELAPDVILAAKPVWAASPQVVSQLLPNRVLFDVVLFDEASQVLPAAALPSIARGRQVVVAGDDLQLPPTTVFTRTSELEVDESMDLDAVDGDDEDQTETRQPLAPLVEIPDTESILDAISVKLGSQRSRYLAWHYRSRDEKLIATSNTFLYRPRGRMMTTFPAADSAGALVHVECPPSVGLGKTNLSPTGEVSRVVDLMLAHASEQAGSDRPLSLGVIAFGTKHAARIEREFDERMAQASPAQQEYFARPTSEPFFIKNIERVQGDERDVIFLTVGYARGIDGRLRYNWGPVLSEGGHRRVNVAITRARAHMALVTSFSPDDVDDSASTAEGFRLMTRFLRYAASGGTDFGDDGATHVPCNTFEADIQSRLEAAGLVVIPQWGVGGYRLDFAIQDPDRPGRFLLAVEADGASYHSGLVARERDRLRQRQLESRGWRFVRIWSTDYFFDPEPEIKRVLAAYEEELAKARGRRPEGHVLNADGSHEPPPTTGVEVPAWEEPAPVRGPRPLTPYGPPITQYSDAHLTATAKWVLSDDLPRTKVDVYEGVKQALGFQRDGKVIRERITAAVERAMRRR